MCARLKVEADNSFDTAVGGGVAKCHGCRRKFFSQRVFIFLNQAYITKRYISIKYKVVGIFFKMEISNIFIKYRNLQHMNKNCTCKYHKNNIKFKIKFLNISSLKAYFKHFLSLTNPTPYNLLTYYNSSIKCKSSVDGVIHFCHSLLSTSTSLCPSSSSSEY